MLSQAPFSVRHGRGLLTALILTLFAGPALADDFQGSSHMTPYDEAVINYSKSPAADAISRLQARLDRGEVTLEYDAKFGYLPAMLKALNLPASSQTLVFSKTSLQRDRISPATPRSLFFNDDVYLGFIPGAPLLELSVADPKLGGVFYALEQTKAARPKIVRDNQCLECHASSKTLGVPGHLMRSFAPDDQGNADLNTGVSLVTHRTPFQESWGGWYVTGTHGKQTHRGNLFGKAALAQLETPTLKNGNLTDLGRFFHTADYLTPHSDLVALLVLRHQVHMHNHITRLAFDARVAMAQYGHVRYLNSVVDSLLRYMLFVEESPLAAPVKGTAAFAKEFEAAGPKDKLGRSLRQLDLQTRLFKHPCSYLIYSEAFDQLPGPVKERVYQRLWEILNGQDTKPDFQSLTAESRQAVREILVDTKPDLPAYWRGRVSAR